MVVYWQNDQTVLDKDILFRWSVVASSFQTDITENAKSHCISYSALPFSLKSPTMARLADINGVSKTLPALPKLPNLQRVPKRVKIVGLLGKKTEDLQEHPLQITRRLAVGLASIALTANSTNGISLAKDNGFWIDGPLPVPPVYNSKLSHYKFCSVASLENAQNICFQLQPCFSAC
jgi:photosystem II oxygen-evolving enhancer protein 3